MTIPLEEQIEVIEHLLGEDRNLAADDRPALVGALQTLKLFLRFETPVRAVLENCLAALRELEQEPAARTNLAEFPDAEVMIRDTASHSGDTF